MTDTMWASRHSVFPLFTFGRVSCSRRRAPCVLLRCEFLRPGSVPFVALVADSVMLRSFLVIRETK